MTTVAHLYALYRAGHAQARTLDGAGEGVSAAGLDALERLVLELALHDATNGSAVRSMPAFERALAHAEDLLAALGYAVRADGAVIPVRAVAWAA